MSDFDDARNPDVAVSPGQPAAAVSVLAPARLHLGFLDPSGTLGRRFGSLGMMIDGNNVIRYAKNLTEYPHDFRVTFRPYPAPKAGQPYFNPGVRGDDVQISAKSQYPAAAWTFVKYWMGEGADFMTTAGKVSPDQYANPSEKMYENLFGPEIAGLVDGVTYRDGCVHTHTLVMNSSTGTVREVRMKRKV